MIGSPNAEAPSAELSEISEAANEREIDSDEANSAKAANVSRVVPKRLLWVDDKPASNALIVELLRERGVSTDAVTSSEEGLERLEALQYDAVITDMNRPEGKRAGLSFTRDVRSRDRDVPVIIYCGSTNAQKLKEEAKEAGAQLITDSTSDLLAMLAQLGLGRGR
jgi:CheY-like chemotaxis protein